MRGSHDGSSRTPKSNKTVVKTLRALGLTCSPEPTLEPKWDYNTHTLGVGLEGEIWVCGVAAMNDH